MRTEIGRELEKDRIGEGVADADNDGRADMIFQNPAPDRLTYYNDPRTGGVVALSISSDWHVV